MTDQDTDRAGLLRGMAVAEIERRFGRPLLWRLGLAEPPSRLEPMRDEGQPTKRADAALAEGSA